MYSTVKRLYSKSLLIFVIFLLLNFCLPIRAQSVEPNPVKNETAKSAENKTNTDTPSDHPAKEIPKKPEMVDRVGEKVGHQIDDFTQKASSQMGAWINTKAF